MKEKKGQCSPSANNNEVRSLRLRVAELERSLAKQKQMEKRLQNSREFIEAIFNSINDAVSIIDTTNFKIVGASRAFFNLFKKEEREVLGKCCYKVLHHQDTPCNPLDAPCPLTEALKTGQHSLAEQIYYNKEGREIHAEISTFPLRNEKGETYRVIHIARDITKRWQVEEKLNLRFVKLAETVSRIFCLRDPYTGIGEQGAARLARIVGMKLGLDKEKIQYLYMGGLLHDIGKVAVPEAILAKPGPLTPEERILVCTCPRRGYELLQGANLPWPVAEMALHCRERPDGSGYPDKLRNNKVCIEVRIIAVCSVVNAMAAHRPYRPAHSREEIITEITREQGQKYDAQVVKTLLEIMAKGELAL